MPGGPDAFVARDSRASDVERPGDRSPRKVVGRDRRHGRQHRRSRKGSGKYGTRAEIDGPTRPAACECAPSIPRRRGHGARRFGGEWTNRHRRRRPLDRGYQGMVPKLRQLGAQIVEARATRPRRTVDGLFAHVDTVQCEAGRPIRPPAPAEHAGATGAVRILIVEDEPAVADLIEAVLAGEGYTVAIARDGAEGLLLARDWRPDLILIDVMLPGVDGGTAIRRLKSEPKPPTSRSSPCPPGARSVASRKNWPMPTPRWPNRSTSTPSSPRSTSICPGAAPTTADPTAASVEPSGQLRAGGHRRGHPHLQRAGEHRTPGPRRPRARSGLPRRRRRRQLAGRHGRARRRVRPGAPWPDRGHPPAGQAGHRPGLRRRLREALALEASFVAEMDRRPLPRSERPARLVACAEQRRSRPRVALRGGRSHHRLAAAPPAHLPPRRRLRPPRPRRARLPT